MIITENLYKCEENKIYIVWQNWEDEPITGSFRLIKMADKSTYIERCEGFSILKEPNWVKVNNEIVKNNIYGFVFKELFEIFESCSRDSSNIKFNSL